MQSPPCSRLAKKWMFWPPSPPTWPLDRHAGLLGVGKQHVAHHGACSSQHGLRDTEMKRAAAVHCSLPTTGKHLCPRSASLRAGTPSTCRGPPPPCCPSLPALVCSRGRPPPRPRRPPPPPPASAVGRPAPVGAPPFPERAPPHGRARSGTRQSAFRQSKRGGHRLMRPGWTQGEVVQTCGEDRGSTAQHRSPRPLQQPSATTLSPSRAALAFSSTARSCPAVGRPSAAPPPPASAPRCCRRPVGPAPSPPARARVQEGR